MASEARRLGRLGLARRAELTKGEAAATIVIVGAIQEPWKQPYANPLQGEEVKEFMSLHIQEMTPCKLPA